jgi:ankyrin repeat protein
MNDNGVTALMYSASAGKEDMVKLLLDFGANKDLENLDGFKAIDLACTPKIYKLLK